MKLLVAVDLQDHPTHIVQGAAVWARPDATVDLLYVDERGRIADYLQDDELRSRVMKDWDAYRVRFSTQLELLLLELPEALRGEARVERGRAADTICRRAEGYDAVVVATHGRRGMERLLLGSVAEEVVRRARVPVLVVPPGNGGEATQGA